MYCYPYTRIIHYKKGIIKLVKKISVLQLKKHFAVGITVLLMLALVFTAACDTSFAAKKKKKVEIPAPTVSAGSFIVMSGSTSEKIYDSYSERKLPIGNITKLMTAMVVIDNIHDSREYKNRIEIKPELMAYGDQFKAGDSVTVEDLLIAMIVSGSDQAAEALAGYSASSRDVFISEMNSKSAEIGLMDSQYSNPTGRYETNHYATAHDCAVVAQTAIRYELIKSYTGRDSTTIKIEGPNSRKTVITNTNPLISNTDSTKLYEYAKGGIYGEMTEPGDFAQYVGIATKDDMQLIVVMLEGNKENLATEAVNLFEYGFSKVTKNTIIKAGKMMGRARVKGGAQTHVKGYTETKGFAFIPAEGSTDLVTTETVMYDNLEAPLYKGQKIGEYRIYVADELKGTVDLVTKKDVKKGWLPSQIYISNATVVIVVIVFAFLLLWLIRTRNINKRKARARARKKQQKIHELAMKQEALDADRKKRKWTYSKYYDSKEINDALKSKKNRK